MSEPNEPSIRIPMIRSTDPTTMSTVRSNRQNWGYGLMFATITVGTIGGFGAWHFCGGHFSSEQLDAIEEVDGFEMVTPFVAVPSRDESPDIQLGTATPLTSPNADDGGIAANQSLSTDDSPSPKVWLTGTIEEETIERIEIPSRISGNPSDSNVFR